MTRFSPIASLVPSLLLIAGALGAQNPPPAPEGFDIAGIPPARGVYYRVASGWLTLSPNLLMPFWEGRSPALEVLNVGSDSVVAEIPGPRSGFQIGNDARPTFFLHGISPTDLYLVRAVSKRDYREIKMSVSRHYREWAHYRDQDIVDLEVVGGNGDIIAVRPAADLKPGEYALSSAVQERERWVRLGFDFGIGGR
jgi:hypothetical protein